MSACVTSLVPAFRLLRMSRRALMSTMFICALARGRDFEPATSLYSKSNESRSNSQIQSPPFFDFVISSATGLKSFSASDEALKLGRLRAFALLSMVGHDIQRRSASLVVQIFSLFAGIM